jgi:hypothetical protein
LKEGVSYRELGANYLDFKTKKRRESYLKQELEKLGYKVDLTLIPKAKIAEIAEITNNATEIALDDAVSVFEKEGMAKATKVTKATKATKATKTVKTARVVRPAG